MACPKGWEALTPLAAPDRATTAAAAQRRRQAGAGRLGRRRARTFVDRFKAIQAAARPAVGRVPRHRPDRRPRSWRCSARWRSSAWGWSTATATRASAWRPPSSPTSRRSASTPRPTPTPTSRSRTRSSSSARTSASPTRSCGSGSAATSASPRSSSSIRARPRRRWRRRSTWPCSPSRTCALFYGIANLLIERGWIDRDFIDAHTSAASRSSPSAVKPFTLEATVAATGLEAAQIEKLRHHDPRARAGLVLVDDGRQPEPRGGAHGAGDHQPGAADREHRPARHRRELDHRAVQRDGLAAVQQHHQPARRPRLHQRRAPPQGRRRPRHRRDAHPARASRGPTTRSWRGSCAGKIHGLWVVATNTAHSWINQADAREILSRLDFLVVQDMYAHDGDRPAGRTSCCRPRAGARRRGPSSTPSGASACSRRWRARPGEALSDFHIFKLIAEAWGCGDMFRRWDSAEDVFQIAEGAVARPAVRHHRHQRLRHARRPPRHPVAAPRGGGRRPSGRAAALRRRQVLPPRRKGQADLRGAARRPRADRRAATRSRCSPAAAARASGTPRRARRSPRCCASSTRRSPTSRSTPPTRAT